MGEVFYQAKGLTNALDRGECKKKTKEMKRESTRYAKKKMAEIYYRGKISTTNVVGR